MTDAASAFATDFRARIAEIDAAIAADDAYEPMLVDLLRHIEAHPEGRTEFVDVFLSILGTPGHEPIDAPWEVLSFCMHALRWPEVKDAAEAALRERVRANDWRAVNIFQDYVNAFEDDWTTAIVFAHLRKASAPLGTRRLDHDHALERSANRGHGAPTPGTDETGDDH